MPYLTTTEYEARFGTAEAIRLTDRDQSGTVNSDDIAAALTDASATVDGYVGARYAVPLSPVPEIIVRITADLARERLHDDSPTDQVTRRADQARKDLEAIAKGIMVLPVEDTLVAATAIDVPDYETGDNLFDTSSATVDTYRSWRQR